jgi:serine protease Do
MEDRRVQLWKPLLFFVATGVFLSACQTTTGDGSAAPAATAPASYNLFWDQGDHLKELIAGKQYLEAARVFERQKSFFDNDPAKYSAVLKIVADALNRDHAAGIDAALLSLRTVQWPAPPASWSRLKERLRHARAVGTAYASQPMLSDARFRLKQAGDLEHEVVALETRIMTGAPEDFARFDHFGDSSFFESFPVLLDRKPFLAENFAAIGSWIETATPEQIEALVRHFPKDQWSAANWNLIGNRHVVAGMRGQSNGRDTLDSIVAAIQRTRAAGLEPTEVENFRMAFAEVTSPTLLKQGQVEFPAAIDVDLPVVTAKAEIDKIFDDPTVQVADFVIVFDVALARAKRRVSGKSGVRSKFLAGHRQTPNPDYDSARLRVSTAQTDYSAARMRSAINVAGGVWGMIGDSIALSRAKKRLDAAIGELSSTPRTVETPVYREYRFDRARVRGTKLMTVHYYVINRRLKRYFKSTFDVEEKKTFDVAYSLHDKDPDRTRHLEGTQLDQDIEKWEEAPVNVKLSQLVGHYVKNRDRAKPLPTLVAVRREMLRDKNRALAKYEANRFDARPLNDTRFDSVVIVYPTTTGRRSLGSGFFVTPDIVLTNYHVVDGARFFELKGYDGRETFGKVVASDAIRDLALVRVQSRGKPVRFYRKRSLDLGATVEAIGHPKGLEFSVTRGVISAVRRRHTLVLAGGGGKEVLFIQTDAPVNPGNSGGPLFLGDRVIGVNTQGMNKNIVEGLNFAVHFSEVQSFIEENLPGYKGSDS